LPKYAGAGAVAEARSLGADAGEFSAVGPYPLCVLLLFGGLCIYLAIHHVARETMERKLF